MEIEEAKEYLRMRNEKYKSHKEQIDLAEDIFGTENIKEYHKKQEAIDTILNYIKTMQSEFDRLEGIEDNTSMLKYELEKKDKIIKESIPISVIQNKIDEIIKAYEDSKDEYGESPYFYPDYTINVLQEILGERDK